MNFLIVFVAGIFGGLARFGLGQLIPKIGVFPLATLFINLLGCFLLAFLVKRYLSAKGYGERWILAAGTGFIGAFTTFSAAMLEGVELLQAGHPWLFVFYALLTILGGLFAVILGMEMGRKWVQE